MTPERVIELAGHRSITPWIMKLVMEAVAEEREACAKVCEQLDKESCDWVDTMAIHCAKAIRARGE